jgi:hypothetical protein
VAILVWQVVDSMRGLPPAGWAETERPNCQVWDPYPQRDETATWTGPCRSGKADGNGLLTWQYTDRTGNAGTDTYSGTLVAGRRTGYGTTVSSGGIRYDGMFQTGQRNGHGVFTSPYGRYDGEWKDDKPNGFGSFVEKSGAKYEGQWHEGCLDRDGDVIGIGHDTDECRRILSK